MKLKFVILFSLLSLSVNTSEAATDLPLQKLTFGMTFDKVPVQELINLFYDQCSKKGLLYDPAVNKLEQSLTIKTPILNCDQLKPIFDEAMSVAGVEVKQNQLFDIVRPKTLVDEKLSFEQFIYKPKFRDAMELADQTLIIINKGSYAHSSRKNIVSTNPDKPSNVPDNGTNGSSITTKITDQLIFFGPHNEVVAVQNLLKLLDTPNPQIEISAGIYEFQTSASESSGVNAALKLFNTFGLNVAGENALGSSLKLTIGSIDVALSFLDKDSRFHFLARPKMLVKDGEQASFESNQVVRVNGDVTQNGSGQTVQAVQNLTAGVTFTALPHVRDSVVDLTLDQTFSDFVQSPNNQPSILKRNLSSRLIMQPGFVYIVGGLQTTRTSNTKNRLFGYSVGHDNENSETEVILLLTVKKDDFSI